jgi:hypothetical protein
MPRLKKYLPDNKLTTVGTVAGLWQVGRFFDPILNKVLQMIRNISFWGIFIVSSKIDLCPAS